MNYRQLGQFTNLGWEINKAVAIQVKWIQGSKKTDISRNNRDPVGCERKHIDLLHAIKDWRIQNIDIIISKVSKKMNVLISM